MILLTGLCDFDICFEYGRSKGVGNEAARENTQSYEMECHRWTNKAHKEELYNIHRHHHHHHQWLYSH
jgi:hypothetical protein